MYSEKFLGILLYMCKHKNHQYQYMWRLDDKLQDFHTRQCLKIITKFVSQLVASYYTALSKIYLIQRCLTQVIMHIIWL